MPSSSRAMALIADPSALPLNWGRTFPITAPMVIAPSSNRSHNSGAKLIVADLRWEILLERCCFGLFLRGEVVSTALLVHLDRFAPPLDAFAENVDYFRHRSDRASARSADS